MREAGIGFTSEIEDSFSVHRATGQMSGADVLSIIQNPGSYTEAEKDTATVNFSKLNEVLGDAAAKLSEPE